MSITYNYSNNKIERDFHIVKYDEICRLGGLPARVGNNFCTENCPHYRCSKVLGDNCYVFCGHEKQKDSRDSADDIHDYYEQIKHEALCAFYD